MIPFEFCSSALKTGQSMYTQRRQRGSPGPGDIPGQVQVLTGPQGHALPCRTLPLPTSGQTSCAVWWLGLGLGWEVKPRAPLS